MKKKKKGLKDILNNLTDKQKKIAMIGGLILLVLIVAILCYIFIFKTTKDKKEETKESAPAEKVIDKVSIVDVTSDDRPVAIMINNIGIARTYHRGLQDAYLVYEIIVEGGISRMMALYRDVDMDADLIGSVRSSRHYFLDYAMENDAIYVHHGGSPFAYSDMSSYGINHIDAETPAFTRDYSLPVSSEHTSYANLKGIQDIINNRGIRSTYNSDKKLLLNYSSKSVNLSEMDGAIKAENIAISYSYGNVPGYTYDSENKVYLRNVNGNPHTDYDTGKQYTVKNIITYQVTNSTISGGGKGRQELDNFDNSGTGYFISEGYAVPIKWSKGARQDQTKYTFANGDELVVNDGNTFIQIQPTGQTLTIE